MSNLAVLFAMFVLCLLIALVWVKGIEHMEKNHRDYDGGDFLDEYENNKKNGIR